MASLVEELINVLTEEEKVYRTLAANGEKKRQIIMVTHNPNLAVVCDADQIVEMKIDKSYRNKFHFNLELLKIQ